MEKGYLALVLHTHLPYVHHPESETVMEERWLFEAITESYLPLLDAFERLSGEGIPFRVTMSMTPTLLSMLDSPMLQERFVQHMKLTTQLAEQELERTKHDAGLHQLAQMYSDKFTYFLHKYTDLYQCNLIDAFKRMQDAGHLEFITSAATHAFLPYVLNEQAVRAQLETGISVHEHYLGRKPTGIWLPECGYAEGLDRLLQEYGLRYFFTDSHSVLHASPRSPYGVHAPLFTQQGTAAFARDQETSKQVWSSIEGYPGDYDYREYYRDIGYELDDSYLAPYRHKSGVRLDTGFKYYRITGREEHKQLYQPEWARTKAATHAGNFMYNREKQIEHLASVMDRKPVIVSSYDTELFGHWWYEGPMWLEQLCRKIHYDQQTIRMITPSEYLTEYSEGPAGQLPSLSSWGRGGYGDVWLGEPNAWMYRYLHQMEEEMLRLASDFSDASGLQLHALNQAAKELMLAQSSDWAFIMDNKTVVDYAVRRFKDHASRFQELVRAIREDSIDSAWLDEAARRDALFPLLDYRVYRAKDPSRKDGLKVWESSLAAVSSTSCRPLQILMLSWEFPPMVVGGLSRHVYELCRCLADSGAEVHVLTADVPGYPAYEENQGIYVHRVKPLQTRSVDFMGWVFQLNLAMVDYCRSFAAQGQIFDIMHAHDWLVCYAAKQLKQQLQIPLVATIHATEHGRNQGIFSELQHKIHGLEWELTYEACRVIGCSKHMENEITRLFQLPLDKIAVVPNGVDAASMRANPNHFSFREKFALPQEKIIFFIGRLVREKGVHVLIDSLPLVMQSEPNVKLVIAGKGPMRDELERHVKELGAEHKVQFAGFLSDEERNRLFSCASAAVVPSLYEPFGIAALEAMAAGAPVIVSGTGGLQEIVDHGVDGLTAIPGNAASLADQIIRILSDPEGAARMADQAYKKVNEEYHWMRIAERTHELYRLAIEETKGWTRQKETVPSYELV